MICSACGSVLEPPENWPDGDGGELCQNCWEADCARTWWEMVDALGRTEAGRAMLGYGDDDG